MGMRFHIFVVELLSWTLGGIDPYVPVATHDIIGPDMTISHSALYESQRKINRVLRF